LTENYTSYDTSEHLPQPSSGRRPKPDWRGAGNLATAPKAERLLSEFESFEASIAPDGERRRYGRARILGELSALTGEKLVPADDAPELEEVGLTFVSAFRRESDCDDARVIARALLRQVRDWLGGDPRDWSVRVLPRSYGPEGALATKRSAVVFS
jgi:hypothetical protein